MSIRNSDSPTPNSASSAVPEIIRGWAGVTAATQKSRVQLWRDIKAGRFPAPIELGPNSIGWYRHEIEAFLNSRPRRTYGAEIAA